MSTDSKRILDGLSGRTEVGVLVAWTLAMPESEREPLIQALHRAMDGAPGDARLPTLLAAAAPDEARTLDALERCAGSPRPEVRFAAVKALGELTGVPRGAELARIAAAAATRTQRQALVLQLGATPSARPILFELMSDDPERDVRSAALTALLRTAALEADEARAPGVLSTLRMRCRSPIASVREGARSQLSAVLEALEGGASKAEVGVHAPPLSDAARALRQQLVRPGGAVDRQALAAIEGHERRWLTEIALGLAERGAPSSGEIA